MRGNEQPQGTLGRINNLVEKLRDVWQEGADVYNDLQAGLSVLSPSELEAVEIWTRKSLDPIMKAKDTEGTEVGKKALILQYFHEAKLLRPLLQARVEGDLDNKYFQNFTLLLDQLGINLSKEDEEYQLYVDLFINILINLFHTRYTDSEMSDKTYTMDAYIEGMENYLKTKVNLDDKQKKIIAQLYAGEIFMYNSDIDPVDDFNEDIAMLLELIKLGDLNKKSGRKILRDYMQNIGKWYEARQKLMNDEGEFVAESNSTRVSDYVMGAPVIEYIGENKERRVVPNALMEAIYVELSDQVIQGQVYRKSLQKLLTGVNDFSLDGLREYIREQAQQENPVARELTNLEPTVLADLVDSELERREVAESQLKDIISKVGPFTKDGLFEYIKDAANSDKVGPELRLISVEEFMIMLNGLDDKYLEKLLEFPAESQSPENQAA